MSVIAPIVETGSTILGLDCCAGGVNGSLQCQTDSGFQIPHSCPRYIFGAIGVRLGSSFPFPTARPNDRSSQERSFRVVKPDMVSGAVE